MKLLPFHVSFIIVFQTPMAVKNNAVVIVLQCMVVSTLTWKQHYQDNLYSQLHLLLVATSGMECWGSAYAYLLIFPTGTHEESEAQHQRWHHPNSPKSTVGWNYVQHRERCVTDHVNEPGLPKVTGAHHGMSCPSAIDPCGFVLFSQMLLDLVPSEYAGVPAGVRGLKR